MDTKTLYENSTGVNIDTAFDEYTEERAIGYDGEYALFDYLVRENGNYAKSKILCNLEIPTGVGNKTTEIDMLMISEYGIIVFEVKNYKGTIYGKKEERYWTQYFKTTVNHRFNNPILQNKYHISALNKLISESLYSVILFANDDCDIRHVLFDEPDFCVSDFQDLHTTLEELCSKKRSISEERITELFDILKVYSKALDTEGSAESVNFNTLNELKSALDKSVDERVEAVKAKQKKITGKKTALWKTLVIASLIACLIVCQYRSMLTNEAMAERDSAIAQYEEMLSKFSQVSEEDYSLSGSIYTLSNVSLTPHEYYADTYNLSFSITNNTDELNIYFYHYSGINSNLLITLKDGSVAEIEIADEYRGYKSAAYALSSFGKTCEFTIPIPYSLSEIDYIKLAPVRIEKTSGSNSNLGDYQFLIYQSEQ